MKKLYSFLSVGDKIRADDEFIVDGSWQSASPWNVGQRWTSAFVPARRLEPSRPPRNAGVTVRGDQAIAPQAPMRPEGGK